MQALKTVSLWSRYKFTIHTGEMLKICPIGEPCDTLLNLADQRASNWLTDQLTWSRRPMTICNFEVYLADKCNRRPWSLTLKPGITNVRNAGTNNANEMLGWSNYNANVGTMEQLTVIIERKPQYESGKDIYLSL